MSQSLSCKIFQAHQQGPNRRQTQDVDPDPSLCASLKRPASLAAWRVRCSGLSRCVAGATCCPCSFGGLSTACSPQHAVGSCSVHEIVQCNPHRCLATFLLVGCIHPIVVVLVYPCLVLLYGFCSYAVRDLRGFLSQLPVVLCRVVFGCAVFAILCLLSLVIVALPRCA